MQSSQYDYSQCTPVVSRNSHYYYNPFKSAYLNARYLLDIQQTYTVTQADIGRLPNIAVQFYGTTAPWRILCQVNQISDPISDVYPGRVLLIPSLSSIANLLNNSNTSSGSTSSNFASTFTI